MTELRVYVPADESVFERAFLPASAIVGSPAVDGGILVDFEGNRYGSESLQRFDHRLLIAAGRHIERYPTVARMVVPAEELIPVGWYNADTEELDVDDATALADWLGQPYKKGLEL